MSKGLPQSAEARAKASTSIKAWWANPANKEAAREAQLEAVKGRIYPGRECATCGAPFEPTNSTGTKCEQHRRKRRESLSSGS